MLIPMKKATLYALKSEREAILLALQKAGEFMLVPAQEDAGLEGLELAVQEAQKSGAAIRFVSSHQQEKKLFEPRLALSFAEFCALDASAQQLTARAEKAAETLVQLKTEAVSLKAQVQQLQPWLQLDIPLNSIKATAQTIMAIGFVPLLNFEQLTADLSAFVASLIVFERSPEGQAVLLVCHVDDEKAVLELLKESGFSEALLPKSDFVPAVLADKLLADIEQMAEENILLQEQIDSVALHKELLKKFYDKQIADAERLAVRGQETSETFCLEGWVRYDKEEVVRQALSDVTDAFAFSTREPVAGEEPPSVTVNKKLVEPYEAITNLYSRPAPGSFDPNFAMAPFYFIFFGMMLSDAGYGIVLTVLLFLVNRLLKPRDNTGRLVNVILMGGISTVFWGAMFGGWFGVELEPLLFSPMKEPLKMLLLCYVLGAAHLAFGVFIKIYIEIRRGNAFGAFVDQFSWLMLLTGLVLYVALPEYAFGGYLALSGFAVIMLFAGRENTGIFRRLLGGLTSLYGITNYLSDILSYSRLFALGLATGVIGMVINTIAGMLWGAGFIGQVAAVAVLLGGHSFNIAVNVLGAYVHTSRLQFIEFFGKFYEPGGKEFKPLAFRTKYVDIVK